MLSISKFKTNNVRIRRSVNAGRVRLLVVIALAASLLLAVAAPWGVTASTPSGRPANARTQKQTNPSAAHPWQNSERNLLRKKDPRAESMASFHNVHLDDVVLDQQLARAPMEFSPRDKGPRVEITMPMPDGSFARFAIEESPIMEPALAAQLPKVKTYHGNGIDDPTATTRFDWTPLGFHAIVLSDKAAVFVEPVDKDLNEYVSYTSRKSPSEKFECGVTEADMADAVARGVYDKQGNGFAPDVINGATLRTYRLAVAATGEWVAQYGGGVVANAQTAITSLTNLIDAIYEKEAAIRFILVNNTAIVFPNSATDPYTSPNSASGAALTQNQGAVDTGIGTANYDIGHLFGSIDGLPAGSLAFSGLAQIGVVCTAASKARGVSTMGGTPLTHAIFVSGIAHELAHQFSAGHTFNTGQAPCGAQRDPTNSYEVGSGSTIMAYSICGNDNLQPQNDNYFYVRSLEQIIGYASSAAGNCAGLIATGNLPPVVTGPGNFSIPRNTPFALTASATDANGPLSYSWEEYDLGPNPTIGPYVDDGTVPLFRGYPAVASPTRLFPSLTYILNNANNPPSTYTVGATTYLTGELLPSTTRTMVFQVVVRDNQASGGGVNTATSNVSVVNTVGPFLVTAPNTGVSIPSQTATTITWSVNGAAALAANVQISLSTDGGNTFPTVLLASTANDGTEVVFLPNTPTTTARIKVEAVGNIFFDISDANFSITSRVPTASTANIAGRITRPDGSPVSGAVMQLSGPLSLITITDRNGNYRFDGLDTGEFYSLTPSMANYHFSPSSRSFSLVGNVTDAGFTGITDLRTRGRKKP